MLSTHVFRSKWFKQIMKLEEQIRVIELKELGGEDERQVYTKLVCILLENHNGEQKRQTSLCDVTNIFSFDSNLEPLSNINADSYDYLSISDHMLKRWQELRSCKDAVQSSLQNMGSLSSTHFPSENRTRSYSMPTKLPETSSTSSVLSTCSHPGISQPLLCSKNQVNEELDEDKSSQSSSIMLHTSNGDLVENYFLPFPRKRKHSLKRYLFIFLVIISILIVTLLVLCSQVTLPGRGSNIPLQKTSEVSSGLRKLPNGNLIHYVGSKFMAPAVQQITNENLLESLKVKLTKKN